MYLMSQEGGAMKDQKQILKNMNQKLKLMEKSFKAHDLFYGKNPETLVSPDYLEIIKNMEALRKLTRQ